MRFLYAKLLNCKPLPDVIQTMTFSADVLTPSIIDDVEGIGPKRKKQLLNHFGSVKKMKEATLEELEEILPKNVALQLHKRLHQD